MATEHDRRRANYLGHQDMNAMAREEMMRRGVTDQRGLPMQDVRRSTSDAYMASDAPRQVQERMTGAQAMAPQDLERLNAMAQENGFENYEQMKLFMLQRQRRDGNATAPARPAQAAPRAKEAAGQAMSWHPRQIFNYIAETLGMANDRND